MCGCVLSVCVCERERERGRGEGRTVVAKSGIDGHDDRAVGQNPGRRVGVRAVKQRRGPLVLDVEIRVLPRPLLKT